MAINVLTSATSARGRPMVRSDENPVPILITGRLSDISAKVAIALAITDACRVTGRVTPVAATNRVLRA